MLWHLQSTDWNSASVDCSMLHSALRVSHSISSRQSTWQGAATSSWKVHWHHLWLNALHGWIKPAISAFKSSRVATSKTGKAPFRHLIYPMPEEAGLGTHLTLTLDGGAKFGPDSEWVAWDPDAGPDYSVDPARAEKFYAGAHHHVRAENSAAAGLQPLTEGSRLAGFERL